MNRLTDALAMKTLRNVGRVSRIVGVGLLVGCTSEPEAEFRRQLPWSFAGTEVVADFHSHSTLSDGASEVDELATKATLGGCDVLALTDHASRDGATRTASAEYLDALGRVRKSHPELLLVGGIEWNVPPYRGREHVNVLVAPELEASTLAAFSKRFDDAGRPEGSQAVEVADALAWLARQSSSRGDIVLLYNHPSRKVAREAESQLDLERWRQAGDLVVGFEGAPGHQRRFPAIGSYTGAIQTEDRWDPVVARIGGVWDGMLDSGEDVWGAIANSDYHNDNLDYPPCEFSRTHVNAPERSVLGVLQGLRAGSFWADHGQILDELQFHVGVDGLELPANAGEALAVSEAGAITASMVLKRGRGARDAPLVVELIGSCNAGKPELVSSNSLGAEERWVSWTLDTLRAGADGQSCYLRARVRKSADAGLALLAYTNPVRIFLTR